MNLLTVTGTVGAHRVGAQEHGEYGVHQGGGWHGNGRPREHDEAIIRLRTQAEPLSMRDIAIRLGCTEGTVQNAIRRAGLSGSPAKRARQPNRAKVATLEAALEEYGGMYIEAADMPDGKDGFLCTIRDEVPGMACSTIAAAVRSAVAAMGDRDAARGGGA